MRGRMALDAESMIPAVFATSISPVQRVKTPEVVMQREMASPAAEMAASEILARFPVKVP